MNTKTKLKIGVDTSMTLALLFLMGYQFWSEVAHEWVGAGIFALFIGHHVLNFGWYGRLFHGRYTPYRTGLLIIDTLLLFAMLALMVSSVVISRYVFAFLPIEGSMALARRLHILGSYWGMMLMSLHLGLHWSMVLGLARKTMNGRAPSTLCRRVLFFVGLAIAVYGATAFIKRGFPTYLLLQSEFVFLDYAEPPVFFYVDYLALMGTCIFLMHALSKLFAKLQKTRSKGASH